MAKPFLISATLPVALSLQDVERGLGISLFWFFAAISQSSVFIYGESKGCRQLRSGIEWELLHNVSGTRLSLVLGAMFITSFASRSAYSHR